MDAQWLKEQVGEVLTQAMVELAKRQPADPVEFLGKRLIHYVETKERDAEQERLAQQALLVAEAEAKQSEATREAAREEDRRAEEAFEARNSALKSTEAPCKVEFSEELHGVHSDKSVADDLGELEKAKINATMNALQLVTSASNVYVGKREEDGSVTFISSTDPSILNRKLVNEEDEEGMSKVLPFDVFKPIELSEEEKERLEEAGEEPPVPEPRVIHVPNVLRDDRVPFFDKVPTLGSFVAVHVPFQRAIHQGAIPEDGGLIVPESAPVSEETTENEEEQPAEGNEEENAEAQDNTSAAPEESQKVWRANLMDASLVVCLDTMETAQYSGGVPEAEQQIIRELCKALGSSLSDTEATRYQAEMQHREIVTQQDTQNVAVFEEAKTRLDEEIASKIAAFDERCEAAVAAAAAAAEAAAEAEAAAGDEAQDGDNVSKTPKPVDEAMRVLTDEEKALRRAEIHLQATIEIIGKTEWWKTHLRAARKLCIPPSEEQQAALNLIFRVFATLKTSVSWEELKLVDLNTLEQNVTSFDVSECPSERSCGLDMEKTSALLEEIASLPAVDALPAWGRALVELSRVALEAVSASCKHAQFLEEERLKAEEEAAAAAAAAAEAAAAEIEANAEEE